jgi:cytochrome P450
MNLVELPYSDREYLMSLAEVVQFSEDNAARQQSFGKIFEYLGVKLTERAETPGIDLLSKIATAEIDGKPIPHDEQCGCATVILLGGLDTVTSSLGFITHFLATHPEHRKQIIDDPAVIPNAAEEFLRRFGVATTTRIIEHDLVYKNIHFKKGDQIHLMANSHGLDERCYDDPLTVNFNRKVSLHSTFGNGPHRCPGSFLARTEIKVFLQEWLRRIPEFRLKSGAKPSIRSGMICSFHYLPLTWEVR